MVFEPPEHHLTNSYVLYEFFAQWWNVICAFGTNLPHAKESTLNCVFNTAFSNYFYYINTPNTSRGLSNFVFYISFSVVVCTILSSVSLLGIILFWFFFCVNLNAIRLLCLCSFLCGSRTDCMNAILRIRIGHVQFQMFFHSYRFWAFVFTKNVERSILPAIIMHAVYFQLSKY